MTAEALVCRYLLETAPNEPGVREAADYLLGELPGDTGVPNLYYWYYGTLAMYHVQGPHWKKWNAAIRDTLVANQERSGRTLGVGAPTPSGAATADVFTVQPWRPLPGGLLPIPAPVPGNLLPRKPRR